MIRRLLSRLSRVLRFFSPNPVSLYATWKIRRSGLFDRTFYRNCHPTLNALYLRFPERHYVMFGEAANLQPNPEFSPTTYRLLNEDLVDLKRPFLHYVRYGRAENRLIRQDPSLGALSGPLLPPVLRRREADPDPLDLAIVVHVYYPDLWPEMAATITAAALNADLFVTYTEQGDLTRGLADDIQTDFPNARVVAMPNHGRDIFPFVHLVNSGLLSGYRAVCKIHTKKSPHRQDGNEWRQHLIRGILPGAETPTLLERFLSDPVAGIWVADGQHYQGERWWGSNKKSTAEMLARLEIAMDPDTLSFPAGSMYWLSPLMVAMIRGMQLNQDDFALEYSQVDGTTAHAFERALGYIAACGDLGIRQTSELKQPPSPSSAEPISDPDTDQDMVPGITPPALVSAFYLPQFHRTPDNDRWWGQGYTEWQAAAAAKPQFSGHTQPALPGALGFYDLMRPENMHEQSALARKAGIDAFCCYYYWFDGQTQLEGPLRQMLSRPDIDFPFYLCWANESWRRNWDGLSGETLVEQSYSEGFAEKLAHDLFPYMSDPRYQRPDGTRPRFVIYRPEDLPNPEETVVALRAEWMALGLGQVELGAVHFHVPGTQEIPEGLFDFYIDMPPHGMVDEDNYLFGGPQGNQLDIQVNEGFSGLIYDYNAVIDNSLSTARPRAENTIAGVMPSWDNTARRGRMAHIAYGANPASFARWLRGLSQHRIAGSYGQELFINAWNEWAEKAMLEPSQQYDTAWLDVLGNWRRETQKREGRQWHD